MTPPDTQDPLSARERQILDILYREGWASVAEVRRKLVDPPTDSAVRTMLARLETKGELRRRKVGARYVYAATKSRSTARRSAVRRLLHTFFGGSTVKTVAAILDQEATRLSDEEIGELSRMVASFKKRKGKR